VVILDLRRWAAKGPGKCGFFPLLAFFCCFGLGICQASFLVGDVNNDNAVDFADLLIVAQEWLYPSNCPEQGLVARWKLDEQAGIAAADSSAGAHDGVIRGDAQWLPDGGSTGGTLQLDGEDDYVEVAYDPSLNPADFTVAFWARVDGKPDSYCTPLCSRDYSDSLGLGYDVGTGYNVYVSDKNKWEFWTGTGDVFVGISGPDVEFGVWTHVAITFEATGGPTNGVYTGIKKLYINGSEITSATVTNARYAPNTTQPLTLGRVNHSQKWYFQGLLDDVRVYSYALGADGIESVVNRGTTSDTCIDLNADGTISLPDVMRIAEN
jgi:hypothetical protein